MNRIFQIYKRLLEIHIGTKCSPEWTVFHEKTADAYEMLFDVFHTISEMRQDTEEDIPLLVEEVAIESYELVEEAQKLIESMIKNNKNIWTDNLLRWHAEKLNWLCGNLRWFINQE